MRVVSFHGHEFRITNETIDVPSDEPCLKELEHIKPADIFVDVGAGDGAYTLPALAMGATVIAFEPSDAASERLHANLTINRWRSLCVEYRDVLSSRDDAESLPAKWRDEVFGQHYPAKSISVATLDSKVHGPVDWIKIDVEGLELAVLQGAASKLERFRPRLLIEDHDGINPGVGCEVSDYPASIDSSRRIHELLAQVGYVVRDMPFGCNRKYIVARHPSRANHRS